MTVPDRMVPPEDGGRPSAVLILFGAGPAGPDVLLVQRGANLRRHAGQPAFPGGAVDPSDDGPAGTALREAAEEALVDPDGVEIVAVLSDLYIYPSAFRVSPVLAWWREPCAVAPGDPAEIEAVVRVAITDLADPINRVMVRHPSGMVGPGFRAGSMLIWGFTAYVLTLLLELGGWARPWDTSQVAELNLATGPGGEAPAGGRQALRPEGRRL